MKIFIIAGQTNGFGGVETVVKKFYQLLSAQPNFDCKILICGVTKNRHSLDWLNGLNFQTVANKIPFRAFIKLVSKCQISKLIKNEHPSVIIAYDAFGVEVSRKAIKKANYPVKLISWPHFSFDTFSDKNKQRFLMADYHFAICDEIKIQICSANVKPSTIFTIYNPVSYTPIIIPRSIDVTKLLYLGRIQFDDQKNLQELFMALSLIKGKVILDIVGGCNADEKQKLMSLADKLNISDMICFHGRHNSPWVYVEKHIKNVDAFIMTSKFEGFSMALIEAISHGIYCISSNCQTGPKDVIKENINGNLYSLGNENNLAELIQSIIDGKLLPDSDTIKQTINHLYDEKYISNITTILTQRI